MKIVLLTKRTVAHGFGGVEAYVRDFARAAAELGHDVVVLASALPTGRARVADDGGRTEYLRGSDPGVYSPAFWRQSVAAIHRHAPYELLYSTNLAGYGAAMAGVPRPHVVWCTGRTLSHLRSEWHDRAGLRELAGYPKAALALGYYAWLERRLHRRVDALVAEDVVTYDALRRARLPVRLGHTGVDTAVFRADAARRRETRAALGIPPDADVLVMAAAINRQKGIALGVEAFHRLAAARPRLYLLVVGDGPERRRLEAVVRAAPGAPRVCFAGAVPDWDMARYYAAADILLYPTFRAEGMPRAILEAMSTDLAVVATDRGGVRTAVRDGETGILLGRPSMDLLTTAVAGLLDEPGRRRALGARAAAVIREQFDLRATVGAVLETVGGARTLERGRA
jgi:glycosyltransferase involved in cell wall biosynthesis